MPRVNLAGCTLPPATLRRGISDTGDPPQLDGGMKKRCLLLPDDFCRCAEMCAGFSLGSRGGARNPESPTAARISR